MYCSFIVLFLFPVLSCLLINKDGCLVASLLFRFLVFCFVLFKIKEACASRENWCYVFVLF